MRYRDLTKTRGPNDGTRTLLESVLIPEVAAAFKDWKNNTTHLKCVLIGGVALSYYTKPRSTTDSDLLFLAKEDIPTEVSKFRRHRPGAFEHKQTGVEIEVLTPESIKMTQELAEAIYERSTKVDGIRVASPAGLIASKLERWSLQDRADIDAILSITAIDLSPYPLTQKHLDRFNSIVKEQQ
jgi:hypothetical protein